MLVWGLSLEGLFGFAFIYGFSLHGGLIGQGYVMFRLVHIKLVIRIAFIHFYSLLNLFHLVFILPFLYCLSVSLITKFHDLTSMACLGFRHILMVIEGIFCLSSLNEFTHLFLVI